MSDLAERILAAIAAKETTARAAIPGPWRYNPAKEWHSPEELAKRPYLRLPGEEFVGAGPLDATIGVAATGPADDPQSMADAAFIADNGPDIVLRHCAGDRELVAAVLSWKHFYFDNDPWFSCGLSVDPADGIEAEPGSGCANDDDRGRCTCGLEARQRRILQPLARSHGLQP